jgi:hypothetical protein
VINSTANGALATLTSLQSNFTLTSDLQVRPGFLGANAAANLPSAWVDLQVCAPITSTPTPVPTETNVSAPMPNFALSFDGGDQLVGEALPGLTGSQTVELWINPAVANQDAVLVANITATAGWSLELNEGRLTWWVINNANTRSGVSHPTLISTNIWTHVAVSYDATTGIAQLFVNGVPGPTATVSTTTVGTSTGLFVGGMEPYGFFRGQMDELRLSDVVRYTTAFTPTMNGFTVDEQTLALYRFNEGSGQTTADAAGRAPMLILGATTDLNTDDPTWVVVTELTSEPAPFTLYLPLNGSY